MFVYLDYYPSGSFKTSTSINLCLLRECVSKENCTYVGPTTTTLSRRLTMHLNDYSTIAFHLKNHYIPKSTVFNWNHFEMRLLNLRINFHLLRTFCPHHLGSFFFHYVSAKFHLWPSPGDLPRSRIGMMSLVTVSPVITAFHSCCLSHHVFEIWPKCSEIRNDTKKKLPRWGQKVRNK